MRIHGSCKQLSIKHKTQLQLKNSILNPFLALKKSALGFCRLLKDRSLKKWEKHRTHINSLGGEYC